MKNGLYSIVLGILLATSVSIYAGGEAGMQFLGINPDARGNAIAGSGIADVTALDSLIWNPAGLAKMSQKNVHFTFTKWIADMTHLYLAYGMPVIDPKYGKIGLSMVFLSEGEIEQTGDNLQTLSSLNSYDLAFTLGYGVTLGNLQVGANFRHISSKLINLTLTGELFDVGAQYSLDEKKNYKLGFVVKNLGVSSLSESVPTVVQLGAAARFLKGEDIYRLAANVDYLVPEEAVKGRVGFEYGYKKTLFFRAGYRIDPENLRLGVIKGLTFGLGGSMIPPVPLFKLVNADLTWVPLGALGNSIQLSFSLKF